MTQEQFERKQAEVPNEILIETIETKLSKLCASGGKSLSMSVPPQVSDIDMAIYELIRRYKQLTIPVVVSSTCKCGRQKTCEVGSGLCPEYVLKQGYDILSIAYNVVRI